MQGFYWLIEGILAGCPLPGGRAEHGGRHSDAPTTTLDDDLARLRERGIGAVLTLTETPLPPEVLRRHGLDGLHIPVRDLTAPTPEQLMRALRFIDWQRALGHGVAVHCLVGEGRTGTVLAAYLIRAGATPEQALRQVRALRPGAVGAPEQERALVAFAARRDWII